uniref:Uncharacterized protein n=1 Tax=Arundo donax TaxID=35708 RepID=A0A0A9HXY1_ARUDO
MKENHTMLELLQLLVHLPVHFSPRLLCISFIFLIMVKYYSSQSAFICQQERLC